MSETVSTSLQIVRVSSVALGGRPVRIRVRLFECPYCGDPLSRKSTRTKFWEKPFAFVIWPRRCKGCGHRYYSPLLMCVRPETFWAVLTVVLVAGGITWFLWWLTLWT